MPTKLYTWVRNLFDRSPIHLAIVRRYRDANYNYVGELYMYLESKRPIYNMIGVSLDSFTLDESYAMQLWNPRTMLDLDHDFLAPLPPNTMRVGAADPKDNDSVRAMIRKLNRRNIKLVIQNRFIEHVMDKKI
jgi:hypothetical protein